MIRNAKTLVAVHTHTHTHTHGHFKDQKFGKEEVQ